MSFPSFSRRGFLRQLAVAAPLPFLSQSAVAAAEPSALGTTRGTFPPLPAPQGQAAFPLLTVGAADNEMVRKSEASMVSLRDGGVLLAYATHLGHSDNAPAPIVMRQLDASGAPTSPEKIVVPPPVGGLNAMSPALRRLPDGRIGMLFSYRQSVKQASRRFMASTDEGATWSSPVIVADGQYKTGCHDRFTILSSGRFLAPCHCSDDWSQHYLHVRVSRSDDAGVTWRLSDPIVLPAVKWPADSGVKTGIESGCVEPGIAERADGSLLMTIRTAMGTQFCSESLDRGETWSFPVSLEVTSPQAPAHLSRIPGTNRLLLLWTADFNIRAAMMGQRHSIHACVSEDGGRSWPHARRKVLIEDPLHSVDYPCVLYRGNEVWIGLRVSTGQGVLEGRTSTCLMRVPLDWFYAA